MASVIAITTAHRTAAALKLCKIVGDAIRELGSVPSGHLYARLMDKIEFHRYMQIIGLLKTAGLVEESPSHLLTWKEPQANG